MQIERFIDQHLTDPALDVRQIASVLGCGVRTVHAAFDLSGDTGAIHLARHALAGRTCILR